MNHTKSLMGALAVAVMVAAAPALAGEERNEQGAAQDSAKKSPQKKSGEKRSSELERCKKEASGKKGPERGSFMTDCLAEQGKAK